MKKEDAKDINVHTNPTAKMDHVRELGKKAIDYDRHLELLGKEAADSNLYFWMEGYMNSQNKPRVSNTDTAKMAEEYYKKRYSFPDDFKFKSGEANETINCLADFAEFHHREKMKELKPFVKLTHLPSCWTQQNWDEARQALSDTPNNLRDESYYLACKEIDEKSQTCNCGLSDLTKTEEG